MKRAQTIHNEVQSQFDFGNYREAAALLKGAVQISIPDLQQEDWLELKLDLASRARDPELLEQLSVSHPEKLLGHEGASLTWARFLMHYRRTDDFNAIRSQWRNLETRKGDWLLLDVGKCLLAGEVGEARCLLEEHQFSGEPEAVREIYHALLESDQPQRALKYLAAAYRADPRNPEVRTFAGNLFEYFGENAKARREYVAAYLSDPGNPGARDNLAEFYRRRGKLGLAIETWAPRAADEKLPESVWIKYHFWTRVFGGGGKSLPEVRAGSFARLVQCLSSLSPDELWNSEALTARNSVAGPIAQLQPHFFWLELLQSLLDRNEERALELIYSATDRDLALAPRIARGLKIVLNYRAADSLVSGGAATSGGQTFLNQLFRVSEGEVDPDFLTFLKSDHAFTAIFLAGGWLNFSLRLEEVYHDSPSHLPWIQLGLAQAHRYCRGNRAAIEFIENCPERSSGLQVLLGELCIGEGLVDEGMEHLLEVSKDSGGAGFRASWLLTLAHLEGGGLAKAREVISSHEGLRKSTAGIELNAKIFLAEGLESKGRDLYRTILDRSVESKVYFARKAYQDADWAVARQFTMEAIELAPNLSSLHENLRHIEAAENELSQ